MGPYNLPASLALFQFPASPLVFNGQRLQVKSGRAKNLRDEELDAGESENDEEVGVCVDAVKETSEARITQYKKLLCRRCSRWADRHFKEDFSAEEVSFAKLRNFQFAGVLTQRHEKYFRLEVSRGRRVDGRVD